MHRSVDWGQVDSKIPIIYFDESDATFCIAMIARPYTRVKTWWKSVGRGCKFFECVCATFRSEGMIENIDI